MRGTEKGKPVRPADPGKASVKGSDGIKAAMREQGNKPSKLAPMGAAKKKER